MPIPFGYILRNFTARKLTAGITITGIALVVFVFVAVLMLSNGVKKTLTATGTDNNVIVTRKSSSGEITSIIDLETASIISTLQGVAKKSDGKPILTSDAVVIINLNKRSGGMSNVTVRGVSESAFELRPSVKIIGGRNFKYGQRELVVGSSIASRFFGGTIGEKVKLAGDEWTIVGMMDASGSAFDSEMWCDVEQLLQAFNRSAYSTITFRLSNPNYLPALRAKFESDPRLNQFEPETERAYFAKQSEFLAGFISILGIFITAIFSTGAIIGATITMYASVANRTVEIGTLRALGFQRSSILIAFLLEALTLSFFGGVIGLALASMLQFVSISTLNFGSFSELAFGFSLSPEIAIGGLAFSLGMGFIGGFLPAWRASKLDILQSLRSA
jgi:putative ABC transport system permease protein